MDHGMDVRFLGPVTVPPEDEKSKVRPWCALLSLGIVLPLLVPVFLPGWFTGHDSLHALRLFEQDVMIRAGHFPVRWYPDVSAGYGSAHPVYYAPLFYYIAQLFHLAGFSIELALKLALAVVLLTTGWAMYRLVSGWLGAGAGLVAASAVTYAPYHLVDLYVRTSFSELTVFATLPLALVGVDRLVRAPDRRNIALAALAFAALLLSHTVTTTIAPGLVGLWLALLITDKRYRTGGLLRSAASAALLGVGLAAFFLIPLALERGHIDVSAYTSGFFTWRLHFIDYGELLASPWGFGGGGPMSFRWGELHIAGLLLGLVVWFRIRRSAVSLRPMVGLAFFFMCASVLALPLSTPLWERIEPLEWFQFPWRFLLFATLGIAIFCGLGSLYYGSGTRVRPNPSTRAAGWPSPFAILITLGFVGTGLPFLRFKDRIPIAAAHFQDDSTLRGIRLAVDSGSELSRGLIQATTYRWFDHLPEGAVPRPTAADTARPHFEVVSGPAAVGVERAGPVRYRARVSTSDTAIVRLNVYQDPGWRWRLNGQPVEALAVQGRPVQVVRVPPGVHEVEAVLTRTPSRLLGDSITLVCGIITLVMGLTFGRTARESSVRSFSLTTPPVRGPAPGGDPQQAHRSS